MPFKAISVNTAADNELVAAVTGKKIRVTSYVIMAAGTVNATFKSATTALTGAFPLVAQAGISAPFCPPVASFGPNGYFETARGEALNLTLDAGTLVAGHLTYELVT